MSNSIFNSNELYMILKGLSVNLLITFASCIFPLNFGILTSVFARLNSKVEKVFSWLSLPVESFCPLVFLAALFYGTNLFDISVYRNIIPIVAFSICFIGYMPARYNSGYSLIKNILYNGIGLISTVFKWTFCLGFIGVDELLRTAGVLNMRYFSGKPYIIAFLIVNLSLRKP